MFKNTEISQIVRSLLIQNATSTGITWNNLDNTGINIEKVTFNNINLFDSIVKLAEVAGFYFYIDTEKDLHFKLKDSVASGYTFDRTSILKANFEHVDDNIFNYVTVFGGRQLTGVEETFAPQAGSVYTLDDKPHNVVVIGSGTVPTQITPGGIYGVDNPEEDNAKFLVDYNNKYVIIADGTSAGTNTGWTGSDIIIDYQRSSPIISIKSDNTSISQYGKKCKNIVDRNILTLDEANDRANTYLSEHKDLKIEGELELMGIINFTPGTTCMVEMPYHGIVGQTYSILSIKYKFTPNTCLTGNVCTISLNKKIKRLEGNKIEEI